MGEFKILEFAAKLLGGPPCYPISSLVQLCKSLYIRGPQRSENIFVRPSNMLWLFTEIYWSLGEVILELYWRVFYSSFKEVFNNYYLSNMFLPYPLRKFQLQ